MLPAESTVADSRPPRAAQAHPLVQAPRIYNPAHCTQAYLHALSTAPELAGLAPVRAFLGGGRAWEASTGGGDQARVVGVGQ